MSILETKKITKRFDGVTAIDDLSIDIPENKVTGLIGPNGSGKTTLLNLLSGLLNYDSGKVLIRGLGYEQIRAANVAFMGISRTFQSVRLFKQMSVIDNVLVVLTRRNIFAALFRKRIKSSENKAALILKRVGLWQKRNELAGNLSYGQQKLLEIARVIAMDADVLLLDEPFAGIFPAAREKIGTIIMELKGEGKTIVLIEHDMELIRKYSDHVMVINNGKLIAEGQPDAVLRMRKVIEVYLGS